MSEAKLTPKVKRILARHKKAVAHQQKYWPDWKELDEFYRGDQYKDSKLPPWVPKPVTNFIHLVITTKRAALSGENPMAILRPQAPDDVSNVKKLQIIYEWVWKRIKARSILRDNIETSKLLGTGIAHAYWDEHTGVLGGTNAQYEGEIKLKEIDPMSFFIDPNAYRLHDAAWCHVVEKRSRQWVEKEFGVSLEDIGSETANYGENYNREYFNDIENAKEDGQIDFHSHYERYWNTEKMTEQQPVTQMDPLGNIIETEEMDEVETDEEVGGWLYKVTYIAGTKEVGSIERLEPNMYPFAVLYDFKQRQEFWGRGTASLIIENQKLINKVEGIIAMIGTLLQNPQKVISKRSGINPVEAMKYSFAPGHVWVTNEGDPAQAMHWQTPPQIPQALVNLAEMAKENIREITGLNEAYMGQSVGSLQTSGGVNSLIDRATMRDKDQMFDIEEYVDQLTRLILGFVTTKYVDERVVRLIEDKNRPEETQTFMEYVGTDFADMEYDLDIDVSSHAPVTQARREAELDTLLTNQYQFNITPRVITPQEYVEGKRMVDSQKIIARMNREEMQNDIDILSNVAGMMAEAIQDGQIPPEEIMAMAEEQIRGLKSGEIPLDANEAALGGGALGNVSNSGQVQAQQAGV